MCPFTNVSVLIVWWFYNMADPDDQMPTEHLVIRVMFKVAANVSDGVSLAFSDRRARTEFKY